MWFDVSVDCGFKSYKNPTKNETWRSFQLCFSKLRKLYQQWDLTILLTVAFRATKIVSNLRPDVPLAFGATQHLEGVMLPVRYSKWQNLLSKLQKFLSALVFRATKILSINNRSWYFCRSQHSELPISCQL